MFEFIESQNFEIVVGCDEYLYQRVLDDFENAEFIGIITYNISSKTNSLLLDKVKSACKNKTDAIIITNIPKRFPSYYSSVYAYSAKKMIDIYKDKLNPCKYNCKLNAFFSDINHSKIIMTNSIVYWGSSNFSDESCKNVECGTISTNPEIINYFKNSVFPKIIDISIPYYKDNFLNAITNLIDLINICTSAKQFIYEASFQPIADYDTNFKEKWIFNSTNNDLNISFLENFMHEISKFEDALSVIDSIVDEYWELEELPYEIEKLKAMFEEYEDKYFDFYGNISSLFEDLMQLANFDEHDVANKKIEHNYGMLAYDDDLDYYAEKAAKEANDEYQELIENSKETIIETLEAFDEFIAYFNNLHDALINSLKINSKIDNTGIN